MFPFKKKKIVKFSNHYDWLKSQDESLSSSVKVKPFGFIQWKGTDACLDLHCFCGTHAHIDDEFVYYWKCKDCGRMYALSDHIRLIELDDENRKFVEEDRPNLVHEAGNS
jgi:hypothetical protein